MNGKMRNGGTALMLVLSCAVALMVSSCGKPGITRRAENMVDLMAKGDFAAATKDFDAGMRSAMPNEKLQQLWTALSQQAGAFKGRTATRETVEQGFKTVYVTCSFEKVNLDVKVVFDSSDKVGGLWVVRTAPGAGAK